MKRCFVIISALLLVTASLAPALGQGSIPAVNPLTNTARHLPPGAMDIYELISSDFTDAVNQICSSMGGGSDSGATTSCLWVDVQLPDTLNTTDSNQVAYGQFTLYNCGETATVTLRFYAVVVLPGMMVDTLRWSPVSFVMAAGDSIVREFHFDDPPDGGTYTLCAVATSGATAVSDCATTVTATTHPGAQFTGCGFLAQGTGCVLFKPGQTDSIGGPAYTLENYGSFNVGDRVCVNGRIDFLCQPSCPEALQCITENTITAAPPDSGYPFSACGLLIQSDSCLLFGYGLDTLGAVGFVLDNYGSFGAGDSVCVQGTLFTNCGHYCAGAFGCVKSNTITATPPNPGYHYSGCGLLAQGIGCVYFSQGSDSITLQLDNYGSFGPGDSVCVDGTLHWDCRPTCSEAVGCLTDNTITAWNYNPGTPFQSCGTLIQGDSCVLFTAGVDTLGMYGYTLSNYGGYGPGDSVCVVGTLYFDCGYTCPGALGCIAVDSIGAVGPPAGTTFDACGVLVAGTGCVLFAPAGGGGAKYSLDNYGSFGVGDSVCVQGIRLDTCQAPCPQATGCVVQNTINAAQQGGGAYQACGALYPNGNCVAFVPLVGSNPPHYLLENWGTFGVWDTVCVSGELVPSCSTYCQNIAGCIVNNTITSPGQEQGGTAFDGCGVLVQDSLYCLLFRPNGDFAPWQMYQLDNYGSFGNGDSVCVAGTLYVGCLENWCAAAGCIRSNTITAAGGAKSAESGLSARNYPNPFNPSTSIAFSLPAATEVKITVYNTLGQVVSVLNDGLMAAGAHTVVWNGTDNFGGAVPSGVYFYRIQAGQLSETRKMLLLK